MEQDRNELSARQAAASLGIRLGTLYTLLWDGAISGRKDERNEWRISTQSVERYRLRRTARQTATRAALRRSAIDVAAASAANGGAL